VHVKNSNASAKDVYAPSMEHLTQRQKSVLIMKDNLSKNNINFVKGIPMTYTNFNITVIRVSDGGKRKRKGGGGKNIILILTFVIFINTRGKKSSQLKTAMGLKVILILWDSVKFTILFAKRERMYERSLPNYRMVLMKFVFREVCMLSSDFIN